MSLFSLSLSLSFPDFFPRLKVFKMTNNFCRFISDLLEIFNVKEKFSSISLIVEIS